MSDTSIVESLFFSALKKTSEVERAEYLDMACGDDAAVRRQVEKLLLAHSRMGLFLMKPPAEQFAAALTHSNEDESLRDTVDDCLRSLQPANRPDSLGRVGHYEILEVLGRGGFGTVFRALDEVLQRVVAVKVLSPALSASVSARKRFLAEARSAAKIRHPHVVQVYAVEEDTLPYLVMELIPGESLQQRLNRVGRLETREVARIGRQVAEGLAASHRLGLMHRDIKPENILLEAPPANRPGEALVKITDFGLARAFADASLSQSGIVAGTPMYMSPEQARGETLDHRSDLFSLGSVLYAMCLGQPPFRGTNTFNVLQQVVESSPEPLTSVAPATPIWLCQIIERLHAKQPSDRFASAQEVADLLGMHAAEGPSPEAVALDRSASPTPLPQLDASHDPRRKRATWGRLAATAILLMVFLLGLGLSEASGVTSFCGTVVRLFTPEGTLIVEVEDPTVSVQIAGSEIVIQGAGVQEIRLKTGSYAVEARKDGKLVKRELVAVTKNGRPVVRISQEASPATNAQASPPSTKQDEELTWRRSLVEMSEEERQQAVLERLKLLNPDLDGLHQVYKPYYEIALRGSDVRDLSPLKELPRLRTLFIESNTLTDIAHLRGLALYRLSLDCPKLSDLSPLEGMKILDLQLTGSSDVSDLSPLKGMPLEGLSLAYTKVSDLRPLQGMRLKYLNCDSTLITDLSPLKDTALLQLGIHNTPVVDLVGIEGLPLTHLNCDNSHVDDASVAQLKRTKSLKSLLLKGARVSAAGIVELRTALPDCAIEPR